MLQKSSLTYLCRSVLPHGEHGVAVGVPADARNDLDLEGGRDGDKADLVWNRDADDNEPDLEIYFR